MEETRRITDLVQIPSEIRFCKGINLQLLLRIESNARKFPIIPSILVFKGKGFITQTPLDHQNGHRASLKWSHIPLPTEETQEGDAWRIIYDQIGYGLDPRLAVVRSSLRLIRELWKFKVEYEGGGCYKIVVQPIPEDSTKNLYGRLCDSNEALTLFKSLKRPN